MSRRERLQVLAVCGVGMGSSLMLRMTAEDALRDLGIDAKVEHTDVSSARGMRADVVIGQGMHTSALDGVAPIVITVTDFLDKGALAAQLREALGDRS